jgi:hypothetical protein
VFGNSKATLTKKAAAELAEEKGVVETVTTALEENAKKKLKRETEPVRDTPAKGANGQLLTKEGKPMTQKGIAIAAGMARAKAAKLAAAAAKFEVRKIGKKAKAAKAAEAAQVAPSGANQEVIPELRHEWHLFNDSQTSRACASALVAPTAYVLFYRRSLDA